LKTSSLPAAVAMQFSVRDDVAIAFNRGFYGALVDRFPVEASVVEGRKAILQVLAGDPFAAPDWATPVLFMRDQAKSLFTEPVKQAEEKKMSEKPSDKVSIKIGNITSSGGNVNVAGGDINQSITTVTQNATPTDFPKVLAEITTAIEKADLDPDIAEEAKSVLQSVEAQSKKEKPNLALITGKLKSLTELIGAAAGAEVALQQITPLIQKAVQLAQQLFH
jgi:flagellar hook-basal body complex protein FliE